jgi:hypothetical protein
MDCLFYRENPTRFDYFDIDFNHLEFVRGRPNASTLPERPRDFGKMLSLAAILSKGIPFIRIDFYSVNDQIYFGEYTFFPAGGGASFVPEQWDYILGSWLTLPEKHG